MNGHPQQAGTPQLQVPPVPTYSGGRPEPTHDPQHPDFTPGNTLAMRHGARSERLVAPLADAILQRAVEDTPWLLEPRYAPSVRAWARAEAQAALLTEYLEAQGLHDSEGRLRPAEQALHRAETRAANLRKDLGLTPLSAARIRALERAPSGLTITDLWGEDGAEGSGDEA